MRTRISKNFAENRVNEYGNVVHSEIVPIFFDLGILVFPLPPKHSDMTARTTSFLK